MNNREGGFNGNAFQNQAFVQTNSTLNDRDLSIKL